MKKFFSIGKFVLLSAVLIAFGSCKDEAWKDHYSFKETESKYPVDKLAETLRLKNKEGYGKFYEALRTTKMCDKNGKPINITYLELLGEDQFLTVWAPSDDSNVDWDLYTKRDKTDAEHLKVGQEFIMNHIARFKHSVGAGKEEKVYMMNGKPYHSEADAISGKSYLADEKNIRCSNGILHFINGYLEVLPNLYEFITTDSRYKPLLGDWFKSYTIKELDPTRSVAQGINEDGEMVYVDSVMTEYSILLSEFGYINSEDSTFAMVLPTPDVWTSTYNRIKEYFVYREPGLNDDSLQQFYTHIAMLGDLIFNTNPVVQKYLPDSIFSTQYYDYENRRDGKAYHIFGKPYDKVNGLFGSCIDSVQCSNGVVYIIDKWPFADSLNFLRPLRMEAENSSGGNLSRFVTSFQTVRMVDSVVLQEPIQVMRISMDGMSKWDAQFYIANNLKGKYRVKAVVVPNMNSIDNTDPLKKRHLPYNLHPKISYDTPTKFDSTLLDSVATIITYDSKGRPRKTKIEYLLNNKVDNIDTLLLGEVEIPYCNHAMTQRRLSITLSSRVDNVAKYTSEVWLDCFILEPVVE